MEDSQEVYGYELECLDYSLFLNATHINDEKLRDAFQLNGKEKVIALLSSNIGLDLTMSLEELLTDWNPINKQP